MLSKEIKAVSKIKKRYTVCELSKIDRLKALDKKVKLPSQIFAYTFGIISALILGSGMSLALEIVAGFFIPGIIIGFVGIILCIITYPIYKALDRTARIRYSDDIIALSTEILGE